MRKCELCNADAAVFCPSDAAFLCSTCDAKVHQANFLVARHLRRAICSHCNTFTGDFVSGSRPSAAACPSCPQEDDDNDDGDGSLSSTNSCVSSTTSPAAKVYSDCSSTAKRRRTSRSRVDHLKAESLFVNWCGKLGVETGSAVRAACRALKVCVDRWTALPFRVCLAASMWLGLQLQLSLEVEKSAMTWKVLKRLEQISGVPAKIILAAESKLGRAVKLEHRRQLELVEGWAEC